MTSSGAKWRQLPEKYGKWNSVFSRFNAWSRNKVWNNLLEFCSQNADLEYVLIDATIVRAHACAAGYGNQEEQALGRSKGGFTTKIHVKVDALGNPLQFILTAGQRAEITQAEAILANVTDSYVIADRGYHSHKLQAYLSQRKCKSVIPSKSNSRKQYKYDKYLYKERYVIECFFSRIKQFRHIF